MAEVNPPEFDKRDLAQALLLRGSVFVHLDPRADSVRVPKWLKDQPQLVLQVGLDMPIPMPDLRIDEEGVYATLSFNRSPFTCQVPWEAVFAMVGDDGKGMVWPEAMPAEIAAEVEREARRRSARLHPNRPGGDAAPVGDRVGSDAGEPPTEARAAEQNTERLAPTLRIAKQEPEPEPGQEAGVGDEPLPFRDVLPISNYNREQGEERRSPQRPRGRSKPPRELPPYLRVIK